LKYRNNLWRGPPFHRPSKLFFSARVQLSCVGMLGTSQLGLAEALTTSAGYRSKRSGTQGHYCGGAFPNRDYPTFDHGGGRPCSSPGRLRSGSGPQSGSSPNGAVPRPFSEPGSLGPIIALGMNSETMVELIAALSQWEHGRAQPALTWNSAIWLSTSC
jgi:hypothetical protein